MSLGRKVFVIHGRNKRARSEFFKFLRALNLAPIEWADALAEAGGGSPPISDILDNAFRPDRAFVVLLTPDDIAQLSPEHGDDEDDLDVRPAGQARPNVLFEAGMAFGRHPENTVLVEFGKVRGFTDVDGRFRIKLDNTSQSRRKLARRLADIGCDVDDGGSDWLTDGDLTPPETKPVPAPLPVATATTMRSSSSVSSVPRPEFTVTDGTWNISMENFSIVPRRRTGVVVHGEVTSKEPNTLHVYLKATFFDADGSITGSATGSVSNLGSGRRQAFELTRYDAIDDIARVNLHVDNAFEV
jgi:hypothetical protein